MIVLVNKIICNRINSSNIRYGHLSQIHCETHPNIRGQIPAASVQSYLK